MKFALVMTDKVEGARWEIHRVGCQHTKKLKHVHTILRATSPEAIIQRELNLNDGEYRHCGWTEADFRIMPCLGCRKE